MSDCFGDQYPFSHSNPLEGAVEATFTQEEPDTLNNKDDAKKSQELVKTLVSCGVIVGLGVGVCAYVSQQHGPRPTLLPPDTTQP